MVMIGAKIAANFKCFLVSSFIVFFLVCEAELTWYEIQERTGLSEERAREIEEVIDDVFERYFALMSKHSY